MTEYVTKEQVIDWYRPYGQADEPIPFETLVSDLRDMKAADVAQVRHGYWRPILHKDGKTDYECSCCLGIIMDVPDDDEHDLCAWCSMCGAKMDLEAADA